MIIAVCDPKGIAIEAIKTILYHDVDDEITSGVALGESAVESLIEMSERLEISGVDGTSEELPSLEELLVVAEDDS